MTSLAPVQILPVEVDIEVVEGTDNLIDFTFADGSTSGTDISGDTITCTIRATRADNSAIWLKSTLAQQSTVVSRLTIASSELAAAAAGPLDEITYYYAVRRDTGSYENVYFKGKMIVHPTVSSSS